MKEASGSLLKRLGQGFQAPRAVFFCFSGVPPSFSFAAPAPLCTTAAEKKPHTKSNVGRG